MLGILKLFIYMGRFSLRRCELGACQQAELERSVK